MVGVRFRFMTWLIPVLLIAPGSAEEAKDCGDRPPPPTWVVKSPYPFQAGAESSFDELYHGPWKTTVDLPVYTKPRGAQLAGTIKQGTTVDALLGESIVVHPLRLVAGADYRMQVDCKPKGPCTDATMHKGNVFWALDSGGEGGFEAWWHCQVAGWDSTEGSVDDPRLGLLGSNEERWVKIRSSQTGVTGWFKKDDSKGEQLVPAGPTTKRIG